MSWLSNATGVDVDLAGQFNKDAPTPTKVALDPNTQQLISAQIDKASRPGSAFGAELGQGVESGVARLGAMGSDNSAKSGVSSAQTQAIRNVYGAQTGQALEHLKFQNQIAGEQRKAVQMQTAAQLALHQQQTQTNYLQSLTQAYNQMEQQRAQFVSNISGLASYGMGSYAGYRAGKANQAMNAQNQQVSDFSSGQWQNLGNTNSGVYNDLGNYQA